MKISNLHPKYFFEKAHLEIRGVFLGLALVWFYDMSLFVTCHVLAIGFRILGASPTTHDIYTDVDRHNASGDQVRPDHPMHYGVRWLCVDPTHELWHNAMVRNAI